MKMSRLALIAAASAVALASTPFLNFGDIQVGSQAHAQGGPGGGAGAGAGGAGAGAGGGASAAAGGAGAWGGGNGNGADVSAAATNPDTRGLAKAMDVVDKTPAAEQQAEQSLSAAFQRLFGSDEEDEEIELIEEGNASID